MIFDTKLDVYVDNSESVTANCSEFRWIWLPNVAIHAVENLKNVSVSSYA